MHQLEHVEINGEEDVGLAPLDEVAGVVLLLLALEPLLGNDRRIDARNRADQLVEITYHEVALWYILLDPPKKLE